MILSSSILSADFANLGNDVRESVTAGTDYIHVDVMDGSFVPSISFGIPVIKSIRPITNIPFDVHLMIDEPIRYVSEFAKAGADIITVHYEACSDIDKTIGAIHEAGCKAGVSIKPATDVSVLFPLLSKVEMVLVMTVEPGFGGQEYMDSTTPKIKAVRAEINRLGLPVDVQIDGGVTKENIDMILEAGANVIVAGSAVFKGDISNNVKYLKER